MKTAEQTQITLQADAPAVQQEAPPVVEKKEKLEILHATPDLPSFSNSLTFEHAQRVAKMLASSDIIPQAYRGNIQNTMIALEMANRLGVSPLAVMQNLHIIQGKPSWSSSFIISAINSSKRFTPLLFKVEGSGDTLSCFAYAKSISTGEMVEGPRVTMEMAKAEGWYTKTGSKWKSMPDLMICYRAAAFFGRLYAPDIIMGMQSDDEVYDVVPDQEAKASIANRAKEAYE